MEVGRPTGYTLEKAKVICDLTSGSNKSLSSICDTIGGLSPSTVYDWLKKYEEFSDMYAHAKDAQADFLVEDMLDIADDVSNDLLFVDENGNRIENKEFVNRSRLRIDTRKWIASKLKPRKYGDKMDITSQNQHMSNVSPEILKSISDRMNQNG